MERSLSSREPPILILVATPQTALGELLCMSLEENGNYKVQWVKNGKEMLDAITGRIFPLAIMDYAIAGDLFVTLTQKIQSRYPKMKLIVIPPENNPRHPKLAGIIAQGFLSRPFLLTELLQSVHYLLKQGLREQANENLPAVKMDDNGMSNKYPWLEDQNMLGQQLTKLVMETNALGAMIIHDEKILAYAGQLKQTAAREVARTLSKYWDGGGETDLARYSRLKSDGGQYLLYETPLTEDLALAFIYDTMTPMTRIRVQAVTFAKVLSQALTGEAILPEKNIEEFLDGYGGEETFSHVSRADGALGGERASYNERDEEVASGRPTRGERDDNASPDERSYREREDALETGNVLHIERADTSEGDKVSYLERDEDVAPPDRADYVEHADMQGADRATRFEREDDYRGEKISYTDSSGEDEIFDGGKEEEDFEDDLEEDDENAGPEGMLEADETGTGRTHSVSNVLSYHFLILPRDGSQELVGEIADRLKEWIGELCKPPDSRLRHVSVYPNYILWKVALTPEISPAGHVQQIRRGLSERLQQGTAEAEAGKIVDYWAPGYMVSADSGGIGLAEIQEYITQTRSRQTQRRGRI